MRIIKKKVKYGEYYYAQYTYRENGKVISKEKYLGKEVPDEKKLEQIREQLTQEHRNNINNKLEKIKDNFCKELLKLPEVIRQKELQEIAIAFTYNTNAIEGSTITLEETREILKDKIAPHKSLNDIKETELHAKVFLEMLKDKLSLNNKLILKWHNDIFFDTKNEIAGKWRDYHVRVGMYRAPDWQDVSLLMSNFEKELTKKSDNEINIVEFAGRMHYRFEKIHPFGDGNGRIGRLIINYILWHNNFPMIIFENKKKKQYYKALEKGEDKFAQFFIRMYIAAHKKRYVD